LKTAFFHDGPTYIDSKGNYYACVLNDTIINRYFAIADEFTMVLRLKLIEDKSVGGYDEISHKNVNVVEIPNLISFKGILNGRKKAKEIAKKEVQNSDFIIVRLPSLIGVYAVKFAKKYNKPYFIEMVGCPIDALWNHSLKGKLFLPILWFLTRFTIINAPYVLYVSRKYLQKRYPTKGIEVACPDIILDQPKHEILTKRIEKILDLNRRENIILGLIGSLDVNYRGHETAIKAVSLLKKKNINCKLKFLGSGNKETWIKLIKKYDVEENIEFCGALPSGEPVFEWIDNIDILVMPTKAETLGRAIIEAMSRGCPVLGSLGTAIPEQLGDDCLFNANDFYTLANLIESMIRDLDYMTYCAQENYYRSFKYTNSHLDKKRNKFYKDFMSKYNLLQ
jgi:glycosyltransferase involved in cell wall biosynthesis